MALSGSAFKILTAATGKIRPRGKLVSAKPPWPMHQLLNVFVQPCYFFCPNFETLSSIVRLLADSRAVASTLGDGLSQKGRDPRGRKSPSGVQGRRPNRESNRRIPQADTYFVNGCKTDILRMKNTKCIHVTWFS